MKKISLALISSLILLTSCAEFQQRYDANSPEGIECTYEAKKGAAAVQATGRSGLNLDQMFKEQELFNLCMASKRANNPSTQSNSSQSALDEVIKQTNLRAENNCKKPELKEYYSKTGCNIPDINFEHLSDTSKITPSQRVAMQKARALADEINKEQRKAHRDYGGAMGNKIADLLDTKFAPQNDKNNLDLYTGKITWGEYNQRRKDIFANLIDAINRLR